MMKPETIRHTYSLCPVCLERLPASHVRRDGGIYLEKTCPVHGDFASLVWRTPEIWERWLGGMPEIGAGENENCPSACGLCPEHRQDTCCTLLEVTSRCNLHCPFCFADSRETPDPSLAQVADWLDQLAVPGKTLVQLSGGEPTVRDDLPQIVRLAQEKGCRFVQLNSNGIRLARDPAYVQKLAEAGLSFVFMQFDGMDDAIYRRLRGQDLLDLKKQAIANCAACNIGVTLVPTLVPGVNTDNIGEIIRFAVESSPAVRGVHFQPVSYFGRVPQLPDDAARYTLDQLVLEIESQTWGMIEAANLAPSNCKHPLCGFHGDFVVLPQGLQPLSRRPVAQSDCCGGEVTADQHRAFITRRWQREDSLVRTRMESGSKAACGCQAETAALTAVDENPKAVCGCQQAGPAAEIGAAGRSGTGCGCQQEDYRDMDRFLRRIKSHGFTVTAMAFQDAGNLDLERLRRCSLHVFRQGKFIPFCAYYLSGWDG